MHKFVYILFCLSVLLTGVALSGLEVGSQPKKIVIIMGPPGSGKGTVAQKLSRELSIPHISTGDLFRENMSKNTELGQKARSYIDAGQLVPDAVVIDMLFDHVSHSDAKNGYLLDGFPRTIPQAEAFDGKLCAEDHLIVLNLNVADRTIQERAAARLSCPGCASVYNTVIKPPKVESICDNCGTPLVRRPDDQPEVVKERLRVYHNQTAPLVAFYSKKGTLHQINGEQTPDDVYQDVQKTIPSR